MVPMLILCLQRRFSVIVWISLVMYLFCDTYITYNTGQQYRHLRHILGRGLCISRATATVLNISCALVLLPVCKKMNQLLYHALAKIWPKLFFFWLENTKSCHMIIASTIVLFSVVHSGAHYANLWNFSKSYDETHRDLNFANHKNQNPLELLTTQTGMTGVAMLLITTLMACSSLRCVRRAHYNLFRYTHQLFVLFVGLLLIHPLSGVLKEELIATSRDSHEKSYSPGNVHDEAIFIPIKSKTWKWVSLPLLCCALDMLWRFCSRNQTHAVTLQTRHLPGRVIALTVGIPKRSFQCRPGQYVLVQCPSISMLEWHPFSVTQVPSYAKPYFSLLVRVKGDWTEALERLAVEAVATGNLTRKSIQFLIDGPYSSPLESMMSSEVALCVAAGVGITPFASLLSALLENPRSKFPGRVHLIWIVRQECELSWIAELATRVLVQLRDANRPDRLHLELYVTNKTSHENNTDTHRCHTIEIDKRGEIQHLVDSWNVRHNYSEKAVLLTPRLLRDKKGNKMGTLHKHLSNNLLFGTEIQKDMSIVKQFPNIGCRVRFGRPHWDKMFAYWIHLYPGKNLPLYSCGPKKLTKTLKYHCDSTNQNTKNIIRLIHEGFA